MKEPLHATIRALILCCTLVFVVPLKSQVTLLNSFDPANAGGFCGITYDTDSARIWAYDCDASVIYQYATDGTFIRSIPMVGGTANDVDLSMSPEALTLGGGAVPAGRLMVFNGETGPCEVYGVDQGPGTTLATLNSTFGASHVVGGAYHPIRNTIFMVQDDQPPAATDNLVAEIDPVTGAVLDQFDLITTYNVGYGDLEISPVTGHLFLVSADEETIIQYTPDGAPTEEHALPTGVTNISGLALDCATGEAWVCNTSGFIYRLGGFPCGNQIGENNALACADGIDNDGDGTIDCDDPGCQALNGNIGCTTCFSDGLSFADTVLSYLNNCPSNTRTDSLMALGMPDFVDGPDFGIVSLGNGGHVNLGFTNNTLINSGTPDPDVFVFEVGVLVESSYIELRPLNTSTTNALIAAGKVDVDLDGYYEFGLISGSTSSVDIDASVPGAAAGSLLFDAIQIVDYLDGCSGNTPGADIDAVCALSSLGCSVGSPCDDNNACTTNDVYDNACNCAGTVVDSDNDGTCDANDGCPSDPNKIAPGICGCSVTDVDADSDGVYTCQGDLCDNDPLKTAPGACGCGVADVPTTWYADADGDGFGDPNTSQAGFTCIQPPGYVADNTDLCDGDANKTAPGACGCGTPDTDTDTDGMADCIDPCPNDATNTCNNCNDPCYAEFGTPTPCATFVDTDGDGTCDATDGCDNDPLKTAPGVCGCGVADVPTTWYADTDGDGFGDPNTSQAGFTCIQPPDYVADNTDLCDGDVNKTTPGACGCGVADVPTTWYADTDGDGFGDPNTGQASFTCNQPVGFVADNSDLCDGDVNKTTPGACGCGTPDTDTDTDGMADCIDPCPNDATNTCNNCNDPCYAEFGTPSPCTTFVDTDGDGTCDATDGCDNDPLKTAPGVCGCGVVDVPTTWYADTDGDGFGDPNAGQAGYTCNQPGGFVADNTDLCDGDVNKTDPGACGCGNPDVPTTWYADTDGDGFGDPNTSQAGYTCNQPSGYVADHTDLCPNVSGTVGSACDDGNANTTDDVLDANCQCIGTPVNSCTDQTLNLLMIPDANGGEITWELTKANGAAVATGGPYPGAAQGSAIHEQICVPTGCYKLSVHDAGGDGIPGGEYVLTDGQGQRLIDADGDFASTSAMGAKFCLPVGPVELAPGSCDRTDFTLNDVLVATTVAGADKYQFWFFDPHGSFQHRYMRSSNQIGPAPNADFAQDLRLNVRVRARVSGVWNSFGPACVLMVTSPGSLAPGPGADTRMEESGTGVDLWPNPVRGGEVNLSITDLRDREQKITVDVLDLYGKQVYAREYANSGERFGTILQLPGDIASGVYLVAISVNGDRTVHRLSIVR